MKDLCIRISSPKFPILPDEDAELVNPGTYGKALALYLRERLPQRGVEVGCIVCEDWGWWVGIRHDDFSMGLCIYCDPNAEGDPRSYAILPSRRDGRWWSWRRLRMVDRTASILSVMDAVAAILQADAEIDAVSRHDDVGF